MANKAELIAEQLAASKKVSDIWGGVLVNVKVYGAKGDGVTDDTAAIQAAIAAAVNSTDQKTVFFPTGSYLVTDTVNIQGHKYTLMGENPQTYIYFNPATGRDCFYADGAGADLNNLLISGLHFLKGPVSLDSGAFIHLKNSTQCKIRNCSFKNGYYGVHAENGNQIDVFHNYFEGLSEAIRFEAYGTNDIVDTFITMNYIRNCSSAGIHGLENCGGVYIRENTIYNNSTNIALECSALGPMSSVKVQENDIDTGTNKGLSMIRVSGFQITDNWVSNCANRSIQLDYCASGQIVGNLMYPKVAAGFGYGILLEGCSIIAITGNTIAGGDGGISINKSNLVANTACKAINVTGNTFADHALGIDLWNATPPSNGVNVVSNVFSNVTSMVGNSATTNLINANNNSV